MTDAQLKYKIDRAAKEWDHWPVIAQEIAVRALLCRAQVEHELEWLRFLHGTYLPEQMKTDIFKRIGVLSRFLQNLDSAAEGLAGGLGFAGIRSGELLGSVATMTAFGEMPDSEPV